MDPHHAPEAKAAPPETPAVRSAPLSLEEAKKALGYDGPPAPPCKRSGTFQASAPLRSPQEDPDYYREFYESDEKISLLTRLKKDQKPLLIALALVLLLALVGLMLQKTLAPKPEAPSAPSQAMNQVVSPRPLPQTTESDAVPKATAAVGVEKQDENGVSIWTPGMYKIGTDLSPGYYAILSSDAFYFEISSDSSGRFETVLANGNNTKREYVKLSADTYFSFSAGRLYREKEAPTIVFGDTLLPATYSLGVDLAGGEYQVRPINPKEEASYVVMSDCSHIGNDDVIATAVFDQQIYLTVPEVGYVKLVNAELILP